MQIFLAREPAPNCARLGGRMRPPPRNATLRPPLRDAPDVMLRAITIELSTSGGTWNMAQHPPRFLKIVEDAKQRVRETNVDEVKSRLDRGDQFVLVDVREDREFDAGH